MLRIMMLMMVAMVVGVFFWVAGHTGSLIVAGLAAGGPAGLLSLGGLFERMNPRTGFPLFRWSLWNGTYVEPKRIKTKVIEVCIACEQPLSLHGRDGRCPNL